MRYFPGTAGTVFDRALRSGASIRIAHPVHVRFESANHRREAFRSQAGRGMIEHTKTPTTDASAPCLSCLET